ncbi:MAG: hypothetical protein CME06_03185 [Gemmatimonadetes bacterium]|nr:hypothetical protein [Gemmatimonadota bacterium]
MVNSAEVGRRIKKVRSEKQMTLRDVARRASVSATLISDIERGKTSPTIKSLSKISKALDESIVLFIEESLATEISLTTANERATVVSDRGEVMMTSMTGGISSSHLDVIEVTYQPQAESPSALVHHGEKCGLVIEGEIEVEIKGQLHRVPEGASIHFKAAHPHTIANPLNQASRVLWVVTPRLTVPML